MGIRDYEFRGRTYDQWELGEEFITGARTITEADIVNFAGLSGDWSATHTNDVYGKSTIYGSRIAYGNVTFIVSTGLLTQTLMFEGTTVALLDMQISYQEPVRFEDTIYCKFIPVEKRPTKTPAGVWSRSTCSSTTRTTSRWPRNGWCSSFPAKKGTCNRGPAHHLGFRR